MLKKYAHTKIIANTMFAKVSPLQSNIPLTTNPSEIMVVIIAIASVETTIKVRFGALVKMYITRGSSESAD